MALDERDYMIERIREREREEERLAKRAKQRAASPIKLLFEQGNAPKKKTRSGWLQWIYLLYLILLLAYLVKPLLR